MLRPGTMQILNLNRSNLPNYDQNAATALRKQKELGGQRDCPSAVSETHSCKAANFLVTLFVVPPLSAIVGQRFWRKPAPQTVLDSFSKGSPWNTASQTNGSAQEKKPAGERAPHKSTPLRAAPYFRPDPLHGSPSRSSLTNRLGSSVLFSLDGFVKPKIVSSWQTGEICGSLRTLEFNPTPGTGWPFFPNRTILGNQINGDRILEKIRILACTPCAWLAGIAAPQESPNLRQRRCN